MQNALDAGVQAVETKISLNQKQALEQEQSVAQQPAQKEDDHEETVEEVKAKMAAAQASMDTGMAIVNQRAD